MIAVITDPHWGDLLMLGALIIGLVWLGRLGWRLIDLWIDRMRRQSTVDEHAAAALQLTGKDPVPYAGFDREPFPADSAPDLDEDQVSAEVYGNHAAVPPPTVVETTGFIPRVNVLPVDDEAALRVVRSLSPDGAR